MLELYGQRVLVFVLVLARLGGMTLTAPVFGAHVVPPRVRIILVLGLAAIITPLAPLALAVAPCSLADCALLVGGEALIGLSVGMGVAVLLSAFQLAGQIISQLSGWHLAETFDPASEESTPLLSQMLFFVGIAVFVSMNGHRRMVEAVLDSFVQLPTGGGAMPSTLVDILVTLVAQSFTLGVQAAAPAVVALVLTSLVFGFISRTLPQLNTMSLGFSANIPVALGVLALSLGAVVWLWQDQLEETLTFVFEALRG